MKYFFTLIVIFSMISCDNDDSIETIDYNKQNEKEILDYIAKHNLDATKSSTGLYYVIEEKGNGKTPDINSVVTVKFKGTLADGTIFNETDELGLALDLQTLILGMQEGIPYFNIGGKGILLIPSKLAYGTNGYEGVIPPGSIIIVEIELLDIDFEKQNEEDILNYINENNLNASRSDSGLYHVIDKEGTGEYPNSNSEVTVKYKGYYTDDKVFDQNDNTSFNLQQVIPGWTEGLTYFKKGGSGMLLIPSKLGYGTRDHSVIPGGSVLIFDIDLLDVK